MPSHSSRASSSELRRGWTLIRGSLQDWNFDPKLKEVEKLNGEVEEFGDAWYTFYQQRAQADASDDEATISDWTLCLRALESRQISMLDAVRATSMIGRPAASGTLLRSMYETLLAILLLSEDTGTIRTDLLRNANSNPHPTQAEWADRFLSFGHHARLLAFEGMDAQALFDPAIDVEPIGSEGRKLIESLGDAARAKYGFSGRNNTWHPFKGIWHLREHLWPEGGARTFSSLAVPLNYPTWRYFFALCYREPSHDVHGSSASHARHELRLEEKGFVLAGRRWDPQGLMFSKFMADVSVCAVAHAEGHLELWLRSLDEHGLMPADSEETE